MEDFTIQGHTKDKNEEEAAAAATSSTSTYPSPRSTFSKYDFVKVRVWLGENADHYYVLSRFLMSRMLTVTKIPNHVAIKIALELKKLLVDNSLLDVSQSDLEANLFKLMERRGYKEEYINRYKMMTRFHHQRVPFVILVCGTACVGKSTIATQLAQRLNLPNVLQTDMVYELLRTSTESVNVNTQSALNQGVFNIAKLPEAPLLNLPDGSPISPTGAPLISTPVWARDFSSQEELVTEFCRECRIVRKGLAGDLKKAVKDGKPIIIEGIHLDPSIYLMDEENRDSSVMPVGTKNVHSSESSDPDQHRINKESILGGFISSSGVSSELETENTVNVGDCISELSTVNQNSDFVKGNSSEASQSLELIDDSGKAANGQRTAKTKVEKTQTKPIIVPIILKMADFDHKALLEEWVSSRSMGETINKDQASLINNLKTIQDYLCSFEAQGMTIVNISATTFPQTLDWLHNHLLQCIERGCSLINPEAGS